MDRLWLVPPARLASALVVLVGTAAGVVAVVTASSAIAQHGTGASETRLEVTHAPPLLTVEGDDALLAYDAYCVTPSSDDADTPCEVTGSVFVRADRSGRFREIPLTRPGPEPDSRLVATVPEETWSSPEGFSYYAVLRDAASGATLTLPAAGAAAPHRSLPLGDAVEVSLGPHVFGSVRTPSERVADARWGSGAHDVGLEHGRNIAPIGASSFDVDASGAVWVLDEAHRSLLRWGPDQEMPDRVPVSVSGTIADMSVAPDGTIYVLESVADPGRAPLVRRFDANGRELGVVETAERTPSQIAAGPDGPVVLEHPSHQWTPVGVHGALLDPSDQRRLARSGRPVRGGREVVVLRHGNEIRAAIATAGGVRRSWRVTSETPLAEVQLAEPLSDRLVLVVRVYADTRDEFEGLVLGPEGLVQAFSLSSLDWAETAPLSRFRLVGSSLYQLGSTPSRAFVDRFDLEVR